MIYERVIKWSNFCKKLLLVTVLIFLGIGVGAQIQHEGVPADYKGSLDEYNLPPLPQSMAMKVNRQNDKLPLRFAHPFFVNITPQNAGSWQEDREGQAVWRLKISSKGAKSINLIFDQFKLLRGAKLFIYNTDRSHVLGAFTSENNKPSGLFATAPVQGDEIIIELQSKASNKDDHLLTINAINHDYLGVAGLIKSGRFGASGDCNIDVSCEGNEYDEIKRAVCKIIIDGTELCSGTMVNNAANTGNAYFLTAAHCFHRAINKENVVFFFNYESPYCQELIEGTSMQTTSGADVRAIADTLDFALLEMQEYPPASYRPYWAGWDRSTSINNSVYSIHHPSGDVKKIAIDNEAPVAISSNLTTVDRKPFVKDAHWLIATWEKGVTEGGSSGGGLFSSGKLIGTLSGGEAYCGNAVNDEFARLNKYWNHVNTDAGQVAKWLDPGNTNAAAIDGKDYYEDITMERISHVNENEVLSVNREGEGFLGYWSGHNNNRYDAYAQFFYEMQSANIHGVYIVPSASSATSNQTINLKIWDGKSGLPEKIIGEKNNIEISSLEKNKEHLISLETPLSIDGSFFVGIELMYNETPVDTFALYNIDSKVGSHSLNRAYIRDKGEWKNYRDMHPSGVNGMYWIDVLASDIKYTVGVDNDLKQEANDIIISPNPIRYNQFLFTSQIKRFDRIKLVNMNGQVVFSQTATDENIVNLPALASGMYVVIFEKGNKVFHKKVMVFPY